MYVCVLTRWPMLPMGQWDRPIHQCTSHRAPIMNLLGERLFHVIKTSCKKSWCHMFEYALALGCLLALKGDATTKPPKMLHPSIRRALGSLASLDDSICDLEV